MISVVGARYARALVDAALSPGFGGNPQRVIGELFQVETEIAHSADLKAALKNPAVSSAKKRAVLGKLAGQLGLSKYVTNFLFVAVTKGRLGKLAEIREAFEEQLDERLGFARVLVSSARELSPEERQQLEAKDRLFMTDRFAGKWKRFGAN